LSPVELAGLTESVEAGSTQKTGGERDRCKGRALWIIDPNRNLEAMPVNDQPKAQRCRI
jgi:hypothetical protein